MILDINDKVEIAKPVPSKAKESSTLLAMTSKQTNLIGLELMVDNVI